MKILKAIKLLVLTSTLICAPLSYADAVNPTDAEIVSSIQAKFAADKTTSDLQVQVSSTAGLVTLTGKVNTDTEADKLIQIAESTEGVKDVESSRLTNKESKHIMTDTALTAKVKGVYVREKLFGDKDVSMMGVKVDTTNRIVYLTGTVETQEQADNAVKLAKSVKGVKNVKSKLEVKPVVNS